MLEELQNIDTSAIEDLCTIKAEQETLVDRLQRMEERRDQVSHAVYTRVRGDYENRHTELEEQARPLKQQARAEYAKLQGLRTAMGEALDAARLAREELEFRHELGEFTDEEFTERRDAAVEEVERCERELAEADSLRERFVEAFHSEDELTAGEPATGEAPPEEEVVDKDDDAEWADEEPGGSELDDEALAAETTAEDDAPALGASDDEPFEPDASAAEGSPEDWDDSMATGILPSAEATGLELEGDEAPEDAPVGEEDEPAPEVPPMPADTPIPQDMMDDMPTGRMEVVAPDMVPPPPPVPEPPPPVPAADDGGGEATAMFSLARLVAPGADGSEEEHALNPTETTIGRAPGNHIQINDGAISRQHAKIVGSLEGAYTIYDLGSENGVYVNRERVIDRRLKDGDIIEIGPGTRTFIYRGP